MDAGTLILIGAMLVTATPSERMQKIDSECSRGSSREMTACWGNASRLVADELEAQLRKEREEMPEARRLAFELSHIEWQHYVGSWCAASGALSGRWGSMQVMSCKIEKSLQRIKEIDGYRCGPQSC